MYLCDLLELYNALMPKCIVHHYVSISLKEGQFICYFITF